MVAGAGWWMALEQLGAGWAPLRLRELSQPLPAVTPWAGGGFLKSRQPRGCQSPYVVTEGFKSKYS